VQRDLQKSRRQPAGALEGPAPARPAAAPLVSRLHRRGFRLLQVVDAVTLFVLAVVIGLARFGQPWPTYGLAYTLTGFALATAIHLFVYYFGGLYEPELRLGLRPQLPRIAGLTVIAVLVDVLVAFVTQRYLMPTLNLAVLLVLAPLVLTGNRWLARARRLRRTGPPRVLLVGAPDDVNLARAHLGDDSSRAVVVGETGSARELLPAVEHSCASEVLLLSARMLDEVYPEPLTSLERRGVGVLQRISARDTLLGLASVREIAGMPFVPLRTHTLPDSRARFKRYLELLGLLAVFPAILVLLVLTAFYVRAVAGTPLLFWQERVGRDGQTFRMVKFRTMKPEAEEGVGPILAKVGDPRIIPACQWLRGTRLDELPQVWNVLRGEMSIVGPRPERPELTAQYEALIPGYSRRHEIPPGITGLAQIHGRYHTDPEYKLGHDLQYLVNWSPVLDLQILLRTVMVVLARRV